jgi:hypothetical protein
MDRRRPIHFSSAKKRFYNSRELTMYGTRRKLGLRVCAGAAGVGMVLFGVAAIRADKLPAELQPGAVKIDPDAGLIATPYDGPEPFDGSEDDLREGLRTDECFTLAYPDVQFEAQTRKWRGNLINVDEERKLTKLRAWLKINAGASAEVYFFVYERQPNAEYCKLYQAPVTLQGDGTWKYYNSAAITGPGGEDLILEPGEVSIYLIGIAWGTDSLSYARETRSGAYDYGAGTVFASSGANNITPPLAECFFITQADNVYVIDPCFEALPGACCKPDNTCVDVANRTACDQLGGQFAAPGALCGVDVTECPMPKGRCCIPPDGCAYLNFWKCFSDEVGGVSWIEGENCDLPNECFEPEGACCLFDGSCADVTDSECSALGGEYTGDYSFCESTFCDVTGACCIPLPGEPDQCLPQTRTDCEGTEDAVYKGDGSHCQAAGFPVNPCDETIGACCYYDGFCEQVTRFECEVDLTGTYTPGIWQGAGVSCAAAQCQPQAACCTGTTSCVDYDIDDFHVCTNGNPEWQWYPGRPCQYDPCSDLGQVGACCVLGDCYISNRIDCETPLENGGLGGVYVDVGSNGWQACTTEGFADCQSINGNLGACCVADDDCRIRTELQCTNTSGFYHGDGVPCSTFLCTKGICCDADGELPCATLYPVECYDLNGERGPLGTTCYTDACAAGACCVGSTCVLVDRGYECELPVSEGGLGGVFQGSGSDCTPNPCLGPEGACCVGDACGMLDEETCTNVYGGDFQGLGTECGSNGCDVGACCAESGDCRVITKALCLFEEEGSTNAFQGKDTTCDPNPCPIPTGACCVDGVCSEVAQEDCIGFFLGDDTVCTPGLCDLGVCCMAGGATCEDVPSFACG